MSTFKGKTYEIPWLSIDEFTEENVDSTCFLLSHCHTDHMKGINESRFFARLRDNPDIFLYCSDITSAILQHSGGLQTVMHKIIVLPIYGATIIRVPTPGTDSAATEVSVTMVPAGHCPGSVMFLLEGSWGSILYSGDFRLAKGDCRRLNALHNDDGRVKRIASLYLDTTFIALTDDTDLHFPSREESAAEVCRLIGEWLKRGKNHQINLKTSAKYGSEFLFLKIAAVFGTRVHVSPQLYSIYRHIPDIEHAVTDAADATRIHCCHYNSGCSLDRSLVRHIKPAALWWYSLNTRERPVSVRLPAAGWHRGGDSWKVFYSCHSSHGEIVDFVSYLKPARIEPCVVPNSATREQVTAVCNKLLGSHQPKRLITWSPVSSKALPASKLARLSQSDDDDASTDDDSPISSPKRPS